MGRQAGAQTSHYKEFPVSLLIVINSIESRVQFSSVTQLCWTLCDPMDYCAPGSSVYGILQARILEWIAVPSSRESSPPRDQTHDSLCLLHWQADSLPLVLPGKADYNDKKE